MRKTQTKKTRNDSKNFSPDELAEIFTASLQWLRESMGTNIKYANNPGELVLYLPGLELVPSPTGKASIRLIGGEGTDQGTNQAGEGTSQGTNQDGEGTNDQPK